MEERTSSLFTPLSAEILSVSNCDFGEHEIPNQPLGDINSIPLPAIFGSHPLETIAFDDIRTTSGAPLEILQYQHDDDISEVSVITPNSVVGTPCGLIHVMRRKKSLSESCKRENFGFVAGAANFVLDTMSAVMEDMVESIDPNVLDECQDRTRSMLSKSWGAAFDELSNPRFARVPSSIFTDDDDDNNKEQKMVSSPNKVDKTESLHLRRGNPNCSLPSPLDQLPSFSRCVLGDSLSDMGQNEEIEVTQEEGVLDSCQLGREVEISLHKNDLLLSSREMTTEVFAASAHRSFVLARHEMVADVEHSVAIIANEQAQPVTTHWWKISPRHRPFRWKVNKEPKSKGPAMLLFRLRNKASQHSSNRGSGTTVSTFYSDKSSATLQTEETRCVEVADV